MKYLKENPLISIILPVYNGEKYLEEAVLSCLNQTYTNLELIIVDDASTDHSLKIAKEFRVKDSRIKILVNQNNLSLPKSLNVGHDHALGDYITWTSDDNILKPDFLLELYSTMKREGSDVVYSNFDVIWEDGSFKREQIAESITGILFGNVIGASFLYRREVYKGINGYDDKLFLAEDYNFFLLASLTYKITYLNKNLYKYRIHPLSLSSDIQTKSDYNSKHAEAINKMFKDIGLRLGMNVITVDLLIQLYFNKSIRINKYLTNKNFYKVDLINYQNRLNSTDQNDDILQLLREKIRKNWFSNVEDLNVRNLIHVLLKDKELLFGKDFIWGRTGRIIYKCLFN